MFKRRKFISFLLTVCMILSLMPISAFAQSNDFTMAIKGSGTNGYLDTQGFSVFLCNTAFDFTFGDQKCAGMEMVLHGERIATNGDIRLTPTPEQWDAIPSTNSHTADTSNNCLVAKESYSDFGMNYSIKVTPEPGGIKVSVSLDNPLPDRLSGRAGFNLEFLPSIYSGKTYRADGNKFGVFPMSADDKMEDLPVPADDPLTQKDYVKQWTKDRGYAQPTPLVTGNNIVLAPEDELHRVGITSENGAPISIFDGRNKAQNGWFVLRSMIPSGKTADALVWHIRPSVQQNWTRDPVVTYSQVGYAPNRQKVAVIELDPKFDAPTQASLVRQENDGSYTTVFTGPISSKTPWTRYTYAKFDFSSVKDPGMYAIEYAGKKTDLFPISDNAYSKTWQPSLDTFMAEQMDHISVREGYRIWHGTSHMDDARQAPANISFFDGWSMGANTDSPYKAGEHIPGLNIGGFYDAGDFDIQTGSHISIVQDLALAYKAFNLNYDNLTVDETARTAEMHRPDGIPDAVQLAKHGALQLQAQVKAVGHCFPVLEVPTLRQYTHLGDGASDTDNRVYNSSLGINEKKDGYSGIPDDRWAFTTKSDSTDIGACASLAATAYALKGWDDATAKEFLDTAVSIWNGQSHSSGTGDFSAAVYLLLATDGDQVYKDRLKSMSSSIVTSSQMGSNGYLATLIIPYMDDTYKTQLANAVKSYITSLDSQLASTPYGIPTTNGMWGGSQNVCNLGANLYFLYKAFPDIVSPEYTLRAANYILGTHPCSSTSWVSGVGTKSKVHAYSNNRANDSFIAGGVIPGYVVISPDFPECITDFGKLWFEDEVCTADASKWIILGNAADAVTAADSTVLKDIKVNGQLIDGFNTDKSNYTVSVPAGSTTVPVITATPAKLGATCKVTPAATLPGKTVITVTYGSYSKDYTIDFTVNTALSKLTVNGTALNEFKPDVYDYNLLAPATMTTIPVVQGIAADTGVKVDTQQATAIPGKATVTVSYGGKQSVYTINFMKDWSGNDEFDSTTLNSSLWHWVNEDKESWSLSKTPGSMVISPRAGDLYQTSNDAKNILLQDAPGDWTIETKANYSYTPNTNYQQGGLIVYQDADNYLKFAWEANQSNTIIQDCREIAGSPASKSISGSVITNNAIWYRIVKSGNTYTTYYSVDGTNYTLLSTGTMDLKNVQTGIYANNGSGTTTDLDIAFDYFHSKASGISIPELK